MASRCPVLTALHPIATLLQATGVPVVVNKPFFKVYSWLWLILCLQSEIYTSVRRVKKIDFLTDSASELMQQFNRNFFLLSNLVFDTSEHFFLVFTLSSTLKMFSDRIALINKEYKQLPNLGGAQLASRLGAIYLALTISLNFLFAFYSGVLVNKTYWVHFAQDLVRMFSNQWFLAVVVWIYVACAELIISYQQSTIDRIISTSIQERKKSGHYSKPIEEMVGQVFKETRQLACLTRTSVFISDRLAFGLLINNCSNLMSMLTLTYHAIEDGIGQRLIATLHDSLDVIDSFVRYFLISHTADRLEKKASEAVVHLRVLRDKLYDPSQRKRISMVILELATGAPKGRNKVTLLGFVPIGKRYILSAMQIIATFLIIVYQFKMTG